MRYSLVAVMLVAAGLGTAACGRRPAPPGGDASRPPIDVVATEWALQPSPLTVRAGPVTFRVRNQGVVDHNFGIEGRPGAELGGIKPGESNTLSVRLEPGTYTAYCSLPGHREAGMVAEIRVAP